jgi:hypothetical protein
MLAFGVGYTASQRTWQLRALVNPLIVGRFVGAEGVAFVGLAIRIAEGLGFLRTAASRLAVASLARLRRVFTAEDVIRHELVQRIVSAYDQAAAALRQRVAAHQRAPVDRDALAARLALDRRGKRVEAGAQAARARKHRRG